MICVVVVDGYEENLNGVSESNFVLLQLVSIHTHTHTHTYTPYLLDECTTLQGEPEGQHMQNVDQLHAHDCHQNVTESQPQNITQKVHTCTI